MKTETKQFNVVLEITVNADSPIEAAKLIDSWVKQETKWEYKVQEQGDSKIYSVDLNDVEDEDGSPVIELSKYHPLIKAKI